jgi:glycosyltransferase involved in cell wall biosynthesis
LVEDGVHGFLIQPHDSIALADALLRLAGDPALQQQFGRAGRRKILREFDLATNAARLLQLMNGVAR